MPRLGSSGPRLGMGAGALFPSTGGRLGRGLEIRGLAEAHEVREDLVRAVDARRQLTPEPEADVYPASLAVLCFDERASFRTGIELERIGHLEQFFVARVVILIEEIQPALLHPSCPGFVV